MEIGAELAADEVGSALLDCDFATVAVVSFASSAFGWVFTFSGRAWGDGFWPPHLPVLKEKRE